MCPCQLSFPSCPVPAVLSQQSCLGCPVLELFSLAVLAHYLVLAVTVCFDGHLYVSCPGRRVLAFMFRAVLSFLFCTGLPVQADLKRPKKLLLGRGNLTQHDIVRFSMRVVRLYSFIHKIRPKVPLRDLYDIFFSSPLMGFCNCARAGLKYTGD